METINPLAVSGRAPRIKVLGVGGAGGNAVTHFAREQLAGISFALINTDACALAQSPIPERLLIGTQCCRGLGTGGDPERGRMAAEEDAASIRALCADAELIFIVAGLGGGTGSGAASVIAGIAHESKALVLGIGLMPFEFEGARRQRQAGFALQEMKTVADAVICLPNQKLLKLVDASTPLPDALTALNGFVADAVRSVWTLITRPGVVPVDFASVCAVTQGRHNESSLAIGRGAGENRVAHALEELLAHPLIDGGALLSEAESVLVSIAVGSTPAMGDVQTIMARISAVAESAHLLMGATVDESLGDQLTITVIAGRPDHESSAPSRFASPASAGNGSLIASPPVSRLNGKPANGTPEKVDLSQPVRARKPGQRLRQTQLPLEIFSRGRFEKSEPTIHQGQDLDVPTYIRRGVALN
jgi:cell division protein FtsZ